MKSKAFTLAETLITLGVIGIVAALTLPAIIQKQHKKELETAFTKSYASLQNAIMSLSPDTYASLSGNVAGASTVFFDDLFSKYKIVNSKNVTLKYYNNKTRKWKIKTYLKKDGSYNQCAGLPTKILADGSAIGASYNCFANWIVLDTNGPHKKPNALGHDLFYFGFTNKGKLIPLGKEYYHWEMNGNSNFCSKDSTHAQNGASCTYFAVINQCPHDPEKTYWECLP